MTNTTNEKARTPGKLLVRTIDGSIGSIDAESGESIAQTFNPRAPTTKAVLDERAANAAYIVEAWNNHESLTAERDTLKVLCVERGDKLFSLARMITMHEFGAAMDFAERIIAERSGHDHPKT